ncbi:MAG: ABC transporter permease [Verrucomicrobiota bacterium]
MIKKILGILGLLVFVYVATWIFSDLLTGRDTFMDPYTQKNLLRRTAMFGIISIGVAFVIITGGIDLSIGSVICLIGVGFPWLLTSFDWPVWLALPTVLIVGILIGGWHGFLVTKVRLQPFVVTLCGLLIYRGLTRGITADQKQGFGTGKYDGLKWLASGEVMGMPVPFWILLIVTVAAVIFLNRTVYGRYLLAVGNNEEAAKLSGINTDRVVICAYVICSFLAGLGGVLFVLDQGSAQPTSMGNFYELYAIAAAVLGGCSLRGGQGTIIGVVIGAAVMQVLRGSIIYIDWISPNIEFAFIGVVILAGVTADEMVRRVAARRRLER